MGHLKALRGQTVPQNGPKWGQNSPKACLLAPPMVERHFRGEINSGHLQTHLEGILWLFRGQLTPFTGGNRQNMTKRQPTRCPSGFRPKTRPPDPGGGRLGAKIGQRMHPAGGRRALRGATGRLRWGPGARPGGRGTPTGSFSFWPR